MLRLGIITHNPSGTGLITSIGMISLAFVAVVIAGLWIVVVLGRARRAAQDVDDSASERGLEALRHLRLVRRSRTPSGSQAAIVAELEPVDESEPVGR
jgi:hypothetical protein